MSILNVDIDPMSSVVIENNSEASAEVYEPVAQYVGVVKPRRPSASGDEDEDLELSLVLHQHRFCFEVPMSAVDRQLTHARKSDLSKPVGTVSFMGPTGSGKSLLISSFMDRGLKKMWWPVVAELDQFSPTSANVCLFRGITHPGTTADGNDNREVTPKSIPVNLLDLEGEDGLTPKNLVEKFMSKLKRFGNLWDNQANEVKSRMEDASKTRRYVVRQKLPMLSYLLSDVVVYIDTLEAHNDKRVKRVGEFAKMAHQFVRSNGWKPALILVQNKWAFDAKRSVEFNITNKLLGMVDGDDKNAWIIDELKPFFSEVTVLRIPSMYSDENQFVLSLAAFHDAVNDSIEAVHAARLRDNCFFSEIEFWQNYDEMVRQFNFNPVGHDTIDCLASVVKRNRSTNHCAGNAHHAYSLISADISSFFDRANLILEWFAYSIAHEHRMSGNLQEDDDIFGPLFLQIVNDLEQFEPCCSTTTVDGQTFHCTQCKSGHGDGHHNPAMIQRPTNNAMVKGLRKLLGGYWKGSIPCNWKEPKGFCSGKDRLLYSKFKILYTHFMDMDEDMFDSYMKRCISTFWSCLPTTAERVCRLCLCSSPGNFTFPNCRHIICTKCVQNRKKCSSTNAEQDSVICPFCLSTSILPPREEAGFPGFRVLSLDGGGVRGLIQLMVLKKIEEIFAPLPISSLFDVIVGSGVGGIISTSILAGKKIEEIEEFITGTYAPTVDVTSSVAYRKLVFGDKVCDSAAYDRALCDFFNDGKFTSFLNDRPPYIFSTSYSPTHQKTMLSGNFPFGWHHERALTPSFLSDAAKAATATPAYFSYVSISRMYSIENSIGNISDQYQVIDGGVHDNCPASIATEVSQQILSQYGKTESGTFVDMLVSLGTGKKDTDKLSNDMYYKNWNDFKVQNHEETEGCWTNAKTNLDDLTNDGEVMRINPPDLGSFDCFKVASIQHITAGMGEYFSSDSGKESMLRLQNLTFAKLWDVSMDTNLSANSKNELRITMRDRRMDFGSFTVEKLMCFLKDRKIMSSEVFLEMVKDEETVINKQFLVERVEQEFQKNPFASQFDEGYFAYSLSSGISEKDAEFIPIIKRPLIDEAGIAHYPFFVEPSTTGAFHLNVVWCYKCPQRDAEAVNVMHSISGFPRVLKAI